MELNWLQIIPSIICGGAAGAFIKQYFDNERSKVQPVSYSIEVKSFYDSGKNTILQSKIILQGTAKEYTFSRIFIGTITLINTGVNDYREFSFGLTCNEAIKFIHLNTTTANRHRNFDSLSTPSLENRLSSFDITLKPFNRKDIFTLDVLMTSDNDNDIVNEDIEISSSHSVDWLKRLSIEETFTTNTLTKALIWITDVGIKNYR